MDIQQKTHPSPRQLAALALGQLAESARMRLSNHVSQCATCSKFIADTSRESLSELLRDGNAATRVSDQSTPEVRDGSTLCGPPQAAKSAANDPSSHPPTAPSARAAAPAEKNMAEEEIPAALRRQTKYRLIRLLGRGGMGSVYEAHHEMMDRRVAIKIVNAAILDHPQALQRFEQEIKAAANLDHPNVARAYDADRFDALHVLVMEYVPGQSLDRLLRMRGRLSVVDACRLVRQALVGLEHAYRRGLVHRDLKPQNLMLTPDGKVKILDFGLAKVASERQSRQGLTRDNTLMGTPHYLAPEQALDAAKADIRADIYSLGCTLYCLLTGAPPFDGDTEVKVVLAHLNDPPPPLGDRRPDVPRALCDLVDRMLAKNPADRPQTPREAADALFPFAKGDVALPAERAADPLEFLESHPGRLPQRPAARPASNASAARRWAAGAAAVLLAMVFGAWVLGVFSVRTPEGTIVVENMPADVDVQLDGASVVLSRNGDAVTISAVRQGEHHLKFVRGGHEIWASEAKIDVGGQQIQVKFTDPTRQANVKRGPRAVDVTKRLDPQATSSLPAPPRQPAADAKSGPPTDRPWSQADSPAATFVDGSWTIDGADLVQSSLAKQDTFVVFGDPQWSNYNIDLKAMAAQGKEGFRVFFDLLDTDNFRMFTVGAWSNTASDVSSRIRAAWDPDNRRDGRPGGITRNQWHDLRVEVRGATCRCYLDGELWCGNTEVQLFHGQIGLGTWGESVVRFRDIVVTSEDGKTVLWKGNPTLPAPVAEVIDARGAVPYPVQDADVVDGPWVVEEGVLVQPSLEPRERLVLFGDPQWTAYNLKLKAQARQGSEGFKVLFDYADADNYRVLTCGAWKNTSNEVISRCKGRWEGETRKGHEAQLDKNRWYDVRVEVRGGACRCLLDGELWFEQTDARLSKGRVGVGTMGTVAGFRDIVITSADDKTILWQGPPTISRQPSADAK